MSEKKNVGGESQHCFTNSSSSSSLPPSLSHCRSKHKTVQ